MQVLFQHYKFISLILWADVIHWFWDINGGTLFNFHCFLIKVLKKPVVIEWVGSDIRIPEMVFEHNKFYKKAWESGAFSYYFESYERSISIQKRFKLLNAVPALCPEMTLFLDRNLFPSYFRTMQRIDLEEYRAFYPENQKKIPILVHTPSAVGAKGTAELRIILKRLNEKGIQFEYIEITNLSKAKATEAIKKADIFLDQFIFGSYGMATCEALAMGKPVFCYIMPVVKNLLPVDCPIISVSLEDLEIEIEKFINEPELRYEVGILSRKYAEKYHDSNKVCKEFYHLYSAMLRRKSEKVIEAISF